MRHKLAIITAIQGRRATTSAFFIQRDYLEEKLGLELPICFSYSIKEDLENLEDQGLVKPYDVYEAMPNFPVSEKFNTALKVALKTEAKKFLLLGSNDLASLEYLQHALKTKNDWEGTSDIFVYSYARKKSKLATYSNAGKLWGSGRIMSRKMLEAAGKGFEYRFRRPYYNIPKHEVRFVPDSLAEGLLKRSQMERSEKKVRRVCLWFGDINKGLDNASHEALVKAGYKLVNNSPKFEGPQIVALATGQDLTPFDRLRGQEFIGTEYMELICPEVELL